jgi:hypothetical protein
MMDVTDEFLKLADCNRSTIQNPKSKIQNLKSKMVSIYIVVDLKRLNFNPQTSRLMLFIVSSKPLKASPDSVMRILSILLNDPG